MFNVRVFVIEQALLRNFIGLARTCAGSKRGPGIVQQVMNDEDHANRLPDSTDTQLYFFLLYTTFLQLLM